MSPKENNEALREHEVQCERRYGEIKTDLAGVKKDILWLKWLVCLIAGGVIAILIQNNIGTG